MLGRTPLGGDNKETGKGAEGSGGLAKAAWAPSTPRRTPPPAPACAPTLGLLRPFPAERLRAPSSCGAPSPQRGLQKSVARTIALSFLFPETDRPWRAFERAVITSSFVGNGISLTHGGAWDRGGDRQGRIAPGCLAPAHCRAPQTRRRWGAGAPMPSIRCGDRKMKLAPSQCIEARPPPLSLASPIAKDPGTRDSGSCFPG